MQLIFGMSADGRSYPDHPGPGNGAVDHAVVGPAGLVEALEAQLGLLGPIAPKAVRIAAYVAKLRAAGDNRFWSASFDKDPWSTSSLLLGWRDALVSGGWQATPVGEARPDALAAVEASGMPMPAGLADRLVAVRSAVGTRPGLRLSRLTLLEPRTRLPPPWRRLVDALAGAGVAVDEETAVPSAAMAGDLSRVQAVLSNGTTEPLVGDGTFTLVEADTALMAAEAVADWLAAGPLEERAGTVVLAPDGDTALLDRALAARGLPVLGVSSASAWRGALQVLPLAFAVAWAPFDPKALLNLLMLPRPPIERYAAGRLARALVGAPGLDGPEWHAAWAEIETRLREREDGANDAEVQRRVAQRIERWRAWTAGGRFPRAGGMSAIDARQIASRVMTWALELDGGRGDRLLLAAAAAANAFVRAVDSLEQDQLPALLIERILSQVLADGVTNPDHVAEAGGLRALSAPGALWRPVPRLVWWGFAGPGEKIAPSPWSRTELRALEAAGVALEAPADAARRVGASYADALLRVSDRVLLVRPALSGADQTVAHPLAHQLEPLVGPAKRFVGWRAEELLREPQVSLAGRTWQRRPVLVCDTPTGCAEWTVPPSALPKLENRRETATSLSRLFNCQLAWLTQDVLRLRSGRFAEIPGPDQLFGNLAHAIANRLLPPGAPPPVAEVRARARALFDELLPQIAAPLQRPELAGELAAARERVPAALEALARMLHDRDLEVVGTELEREGAAGALPLYGRLDLVVRRAGRAALLDLKWTRSARRYQEEVAEGRAVQLAVYGVLAEPGTPDLAPGGYFLLRQRRMIAERGSPLADDNIEVVRNQGDTLQAVVDDWGRWRDLVAEGVVIAAGVDGADNRRPEGLVFEAAKEPCRFCDLTGLCRINVEAV